MKPPPTDPLAFRDRVFDALCNDLAEGKGVERTEALRHMARSNGADPALALRAEPVARLGLPASIGAEGKCK